MGNFAEGLIGIVLDGRYRLDAVLGEGGMGSVFRAHHLAMDRKVAVKLLKPHLTNDTNALQRFAAEARRTMRVDSPHAVKVIDAGVTAQQDYFIVLEYLDGRTVQRELEVDGPFVATRVVHIARQALHALGAAHASGLVHRDIKPDNLMLLRQGDDPDFTKVLDFGVAKLMQGATPTDRSALALTAQGMVFGTPEFMSPEQACGLPLDGRSDFYALAATMFAMLTGCGLFDAKSPIEWLTCHARTPPPHLADVSGELAEYGELDDLLQRCLAKRAEKRPKDAAELDGLLDRIERRLHGKPVTAPGRPIKSVFSSSTYVAALPEPASADKPATAQTVLARSLTDGEAMHDDVPPRSRVGLFVALGAAALAGMLGLALYLATRDHGARTTPPDGVVIAHPATADAPPAQLIVDGGPIDAALDAPAVDAASIDAPAPARVDAAVAVHHDAGPPPPDPKAQEIAQHLAAARSAPNALKELAEADAALKLDPGNVMARYYKGDALLKYNNQDDGCQILAGIKGFPPAKKRATDAGCPP